jgi:murein DD-endopeptidase MepM/ murein hydrolase activator NlpD
MPAPMRAQWPPRASLLVVAAALAGPPVFAQSDCSKGVFCVDARQEGTRVVLSGRNLASFEVTATLDATLRNMKSDVALPVTFTLPGGGSRAVATLRASDPGREWRYDYSYHWVYGTTEADHDEDEVYALPYDVGSAFSVIQGFDGSFSHNGDCRYAIDWGMPEGTPVRAARAGLVVGARDNFYAGGADRSLEDFANYVMVKHADGTVGEYDHFRQRGVVVRVGQRVKEGELLGHSGNTGFSSTPHLHLCVYKAVNGRRRESFPIRFRTAGSPSEVLVEGRRYEAAP